MNNGRGLTFVLLASMIMMSAILLQSVFTKKPVDEANQVADVEGGEQANDTDAETPTDTETQSNSQETDAADQSGEDENAQDDQSVKPPRVAKDELVTIGSLAADGSDRYLVTLNKRGGTIRRIELNFRNDDGRYKYRDIVWEGGYLGSLDCDDTSDGCKVRVVGKGTPAQLAGMLVGDVIVSVNDEPIVDAEGFEDILNKKTKPFTNITLVVRRDGQQQPLDIALTDKPLEVIRPEPGLVDDEFDYPESFVTALVQPSDPSSVWPDLDDGMRDTNWTVLDSEQPNVIELQFELAAAQLKAMEIPGPVTVIKRFTIPELPVESINEPDSRTFHLEFDFEVKNGSDQPLKIAYQIAGPTGTTAETWWYANKIHGRQTAIGYMAGARDIVGSTAAQSYVFYGCPEIVKDAQKTQPKINFISSPFEDEEDQLLNWVGVDSHYFNVSLIPRVADGEAFKCDSVTAYLNNRQGQIPNIPKNARLQKLVDCTFQLTAPIEIPAGESVVKSFDVFVGPKEPSVLAHYNLSDVRTFGWFGWCSIVLLWILHFFYAITFNFSYGLAIIMLTVLVRCLMIPMSRKAAINAQMMQHLQPQMKEIADKYKDDFEKRGQAQRELYKKYNFNPFGGCFMMFFQLPVFYGLYKALNVDIALRDQPFIPGLSWCSNLAAPDQLIYWKNWMPGMLADETGWLGPYFNVLPILTMVLFIVQQRLFTPPATDDQQKLMQRMMTFMMVFMGIMFFKVPAGLCIYFITSSLWGIIERKLLPKPVLDTEKLAVESTGPTRATRKVEKAKLAAEEKRQSEADARKQRNAERKRKLKQRGL